jgi:cytochrome b6-f complex iron-sulfur subunit
MSARDVRRFVEEVLRGRRPRSFRPDDQEAAEMRTAIALRAARTGAGAPSEEFVSDLHRRLAAELATDGGEPVTTLTGTRRQVIRFGSVAAAAIGTGIVLDQTLIHRGGTGSTTAAEDATPATLTPTTGTWSAVASSTDLPEGAVHPFEVGGVAGFVRRSDGQVNAVSGTCTHQGCRLRLDAPGRRLQCPCHATAFAVTGELLTHELPVPPGPLPSLVVRETDGKIEVYAPPPSA